MNRKHELKIENLALSIIGPPGLRAKIVFRSLGSSLSSITPSIRRSRQPKPKTIAGKPLRTDLSATSLEFETKTIPKCSQAVVWTDGPNILERTLRLSRTSIINSCILSLYEDHTEVSALKKLLLMTICFAALFLIGCSEEQIDDAADKLDEAMETVGDSLDDAVDDAADAVDDAIDNAADAVDDAVDDATDALNEAVDDASDAAKEAADKAGDAAKDAADKAKELGEETAEKAKKAAKGT